jgi:hypothetical protein
MQIYADVSKGQLMHRPRKKKKKRNKISAYSIHSIVMEVIS